MNASIQPKITQNITMPLNGYRLDIEVYWILGCKISLVTVVNRILWKAHPYMPF